MGRRAYEYSTRPQLSASERDGDETDRKYGPGQHFDDSGSVLLVPGGIACDQRRRAAETYVRATEDAVVDEFVEAHVALFLAAAGDELHRLKRDGVSETRSFHSRYWAREMGFYLLRREGVFLLGTEGRHIGCLSRFFLINRVPENRSGNLATEAVNLTAKRGSATFGHYSRGSALC